MDAGANGNGSGDWRSGLAKEARTKMVKRIMETVQGHTPVASQKGMSDLFDVAERFERKVFAAATNQQDYLRKISVKMLSLKTRAQPPADGRMAGGIAQGGDPGSMCSLRNHTQPSAGGAQVEQNALATTSVPDPAQSTTPAQADQLLQHQHEQEQQQRQIEQVHQLLQQLQQQLQQQQQQQQQLQGHIEQLQQQILLPQQLLQQLQERQQHREQQQQQWHIEQVHKLLQQLQQQQQQLQQQQQQQLQLQGHIEQLHQQILLPQQLLQQLQERQQHREQQQQQWHIEQLDQQALLLQQQVQQEQQQQQPQPQPQQQQQPQPQRQRQQQPQLQPVVHQSFQVAQRLIKQQPVVQANQQRALREASSSASLDSSGQSIVDQRDLVWSKLQVLKEKHFQDMRGLYNKVSQKCTQVMPPEQLSKLHHCKEVLQRILPYLTVPKERLPKEFNLEKVETFGRQIVSIMETFKRRKPAQTQQTQQRGQQAHQGQQTLSHQPGLSGQMMQTHQVQLQQMPPGVQTQSWQQQQQTLSQLQHQDKQGQQVQQPLQYIPAQVAVSTLHASNLSSLKPNGGYGPQQNMMNLQQNGVTSPAQSSMWCNIGWKRTS